MRLMTAESLARFPEENPNPVMRIGTDGTMVYANEAGMPVLQALGVGIGEPVPEDVQYAVEDALSSGDPQTLVVSSETVTFGITLMPVRGREYLNVFGRDITRERQAQKRIRDLARFPDENPNPVLRVSRELAVLYANEPAQAVLAAWQVGVGGLIPEEYRAKVRSGFRSERNVYLEVRYGASVYALLVAPVQDGDYANVYGREVTRLKRAENELVRANETLEVQNAKLADTNAALTQANRLKDEFLANTSHELRTPLNGIVGIAESLLDGAAGHVSEPMRENLSLIVSSGRRLSRLVNDILDFSKLQKQDLELSLRAVDLRTAVEVVLMLCQPLVQNRPLVLKNEVPNDLPLALADEDRLQQILHNLIGNAIKFTPEGEIRVGAQRRSSNGAEQLTVTVADSGIGIKEEMQPHIFGAFEQGDGSLAREYGGTGLGLSVTRALVDLHGGDIGVDSAPGEGSTFHFTVPVATSEDRKQYGDAAKGTVDTMLARLRGDGEMSNREMMMGEARDEAPQEYAAPAGEPVTVLIVDDDPVNLRVLRNHLSTRGYVVVQAESGPEALGLIGDGLKPDLVLLDVMMPRMSGYEVCRELRTLFPQNEVPVMLVTARTQVADLVDGMKAGANDYLTKPISKTELLARLRTHLTNARMSVAAGRFVPREFLKILGHDTLVDVVRGDHMEKEMSVLFSDIRSFTTIVEHRTPAENFAFINEYLSHMEPPIRKHGGFIDSYEGDAIMALFEGTADDAVQAAIGDLNALAALNESRTKHGEPVLRIGIGVNTGHLMLGTIGGLERIKCGVIGDPVNLAARIESMTKVYGASLLISEHTYHRLADPERYQIRPADRVIVKGKTEPVTVYEVLDGLPEAERESKLKGREPFAKAWALFRAGKMKDALDGFEELVQVAPDDAVVKLYLERCRSYIDNGVPEGWDGVAS
jgi:two-component system sensor histidine kinase ChiS